MNFTVHPFKKVKNEYDFHTKEADNSPSKYDFSKPDQNQFASQPHIGKPFYTDNNDLEQNASNFKSTRVNKYNTEVDLKNNTDNILDGLSSDGVEPSKTEIARRGDILTKWKKFSDQILTFRHSSEQTPQDEARLAEFFNLPNYKSYEPENNVTWITKSAKSYTDKDLIVRIARYPHGTEWDSPITTNDGAVYTKGGWRFQSNSKEPSPQDYAIKEIDSSRSQMSTIHCHGCELSWPFINKARAYSAQRLMQRKVPEFDIFMDASFAPPDQNSFIFDKNNESEGKVQSCNAFTEKLLYKDDGKKNIVFFIRFTGKYKERQSGIFEEGGFSENRPYCLRCLQEICVKKMCPLKFDSITKIINEPNNYFQMLRNNFTEDNSMVLNVSPMDK